MTENRQNQMNSGNNSQLDAQLVSTVTTAVVQAIQSMDASTQKKKNAEDDAANKSRTIDLVGLVFFILEKLWLVLLVAIIGAGVFGYRASKAVPVYTATAKLYIVNADSPTISFTDLQLGTVLTLDYQEVFKTWEVHEMVRQELDLPYSYDQMQSFISVTNPEDTRLLYITATHYDAQIAANIANAYAGAAKTFILNTMRSDEPSDFSIALVPSKGYVASKSSAVLKGFMLGSVLMVGILALMFVLDDRPRTPENISMYGGIPTLAVLPSVKDVRKHVNRNKSLKAWWRGE